MCGNSTLPLAFSSMSTVSIFLKTGEWAANGKVWHSSSSFPSSRPKTMVTIPGPRSTKVSAFASMFYVLKTKPVPYFYVKKVRKREGIISMDASLKKKLCEQTKYKKSL
jgi:hypothetical protein